MSQMKHRAGFGSAGSRLSDQGRSILQPPQTQQNRSATRFPEGVFDRFNPGEKAVWINISPLQSWTFMAYDPEAGEVVQQNKSWFPYVKHYYARTKQMMNCSAGPNRDQPCYGCAINKAFYQKMDAIEQRTGVRPKDESPMSAQKCFGLAVTIMENIVSMPAVDRNGVARKNKAGEPIYDYIPQPLLGTGPTNHAVSFGRRAHMTLGITHLRQLLVFDEEMRNYCGNCAGAMKASSIVCPDCESTYNLPDAVTGDDLVETRGRDFNCNACGYRGVMRPTLECKCGDPREGKLTDFDVRIKREKLGDKQSMLSIKGIRLPKLDNPEIRKMVESPLDLPKIFAPSSLEDQQRRLGEVARGVDPRSHHKAASADTESYVDSSNSEDEDLPYSR